MRTLACAALLLALARPLNSQEQAAPAPQDEAPAATDDREARLTTVEGTVYVHLRDHADGEFIAAEPDAPVEEGDLVRTGTDGHAEMTLDGETVIDMSPNTDFLVTSLAKEQTEFHIGIGSIAAKIKSLISGEKMSFHTNSAVAAVRGTELGVSQEADDKPARIGVFDEGHVSVTSPEGGHEVKLGPGQETAVARNAAPGKPGALRSFAPFRDRMQAIRRRQEFMRRNWQARPFQQRLALRRELAQRKRMRAEQMRNVRADIMRRGYARQQQRRQEIQQRVQKLRQQRRQRLQQEQRLRQQQQQQRQRQEQQRRQQQEQRQKQVQEKRQKEAQEHREAMERRRAQEAQARRQDQAREKAKQERFEQMRAERQRQKEERRKQVQEQRRQRIDQQREERRKKKRQQPQQ